VSPRNWELRVGDILGAIAAIRTYTAGMSLECFSADRRTVDAVMHNIMVLGEAAGSIPDDVARRHPAVPWDKMRAIRNVVVHAYFGIRTEILWETIQHDLPPLIPLLDAMLKRP
jgi:uncharacterized protein with HEPN domain